MSCRPLVELLEELRFTAQLSPKTRADVAGISVAREFAAGSIIFREGAECHELFVLTAGHVALDMHVPARGAVRILTVGPGEMLGWSAVVSEGRMTATGTALDQVSTIAISGPRLKDLCNSDHALGYQVMRQMAVELSRRLLATRLQLIDLFSHTAPRIPESKDYRSP